MSGNTSPETEVPDEAEEVRDEQEDDRLAGPRLLSVVPADLAQILADIDEDEK